MECVTRFCPTVESGLLHIGHLFNLWFNKFYALKHHGKFCCIADCPESAQRLAREYSGMGQAFISGHSKWYGVEKWEAMLDNAFWDCEPSCFKKCNIYLMNDILVPKILCTPNIYDAGAWLRLFPDLDIDLHYFLKDHPYHGTVLADLVLKINVFIRGKDLKQDEHLNNVFDEILLKDIIFDKLAGWEVKRYYHPLLLDTNGEKICKVKDIEHPSILSLLLRVLKHKANPGYVFVLFVASTLEGRIVSHEELMNYHETFDIEKVCEMDDFVYDDKMMQAIIDLSAKMVRDQPVCHDSYTSRYQNISTYVNSAPNIEIGQLYSKIL